MEVCVQNVEDVSRRLHFSVHLLNVAEIQFAGHVVPLTESFAGCLSSQSGPSYSVSEAIAAQTTHKHAHTHTPHSALCLA